VSEGATARLVPLDERHRARFAEELPRLIAWRLQRQAPGDLIWGLEAVAYSAIALLGLGLWQWSPALMLLHLLLSQWIGLVAEVLVLRRLARLGVTRMLSVSHVAAFVEEIAKRLEAQHEHGMVGEPLLVSESLMLDSDVPNDSTDKTSPGAFAVTLVLLGAMATVFSLIAVAMADGSLREELLREPLALLTLGVMSVVQLVACVRRLRAPPLPGASWQIEFVPGLRAFGLVLLSMLAIGFSQSHEDVKELMMVVYACIGAWGLIAALSIPLIHRQVERLQAQQLLAVAVWGRGGASK
jgi:hypothetical protein